MKLGRLLASIASAAEGAQEVPIGTNQGVYVERVLRQVGLKPGDPWCAAAVYDWGRALSEALGIGWPLPATGGCAVLGDFAKEHDILMDLVDGPEVGDVFLIWHQELGRFAHTGVLTALPSLTISGNTVPPKRPGNSREGYIVAKKPWQFRAADRFIRWTELVKA